MTDRDQATSVAVTPESPEALALFPAGRCARIAASLDLAPEHRAEVLAASDLTEERWEALFDHWEAAIETEAASGRGDTLSLMDGAYVARCEEERGPVTLADYATLLVGAERGATDDALDALDLPHASYLPLSRVWESRLANDAEVRRELRVHVARVREGLGQ